MYRAGDGVLNRVGDRPDRCFATVVPMIPYSQILAPPICDGASISQPKGPSGASRRQGRSLYIGNSAKNV